LISVYDWLSVSEWNSETSPLQRGDSVTAHGEKAGEAIAENSYFATVDSIVDGGKVKIVQDGGEVTVLSRGQLRHRVFKNAVCASVSDDRRHCRHQVQHFAVQELRWLEKRLHEDHPADLNTSHILSLHLHSDNASSHFKSTGAVEWTSRLAETQATACQKGDAAR
jgi:hypothetical protein